MRFKITLFFLLLFTVNSFSQGEKKLVILHTNDLHSRLTGFGPESDSSH